MGSKGKLESGSLRSRLPRGRIIKTTRRIGGKTWKYVGQFLTKKRAKQVAKLERGAGHKARVIPRKKPRRFVVYVDEK